MVLSVPNDAPPPDVPDTVEAQPLKLLSAENILAAEDLVYEDVPAWGGLVRVQVMPGWERDDFELTTTEGRGKNAKQNLRNLRARLVARCCVNAAGERLFSDAQAEALGKKSGTELDKVFSACRRLNGLTAADVEELTKNS